MEYEIHEVAARFPSLKTTDPDAHDAMSRGRSKWSGTGQDSARDSDIGDHELAIGDGGPDWCKRCGTWDLYLRRHDGTPVDCLPLAKPECSCCYAEVVTGTYWIVLHETVTEICGRPAIVCEHRCENHERENE